VIIIQYHSNSDKAITEAVNTLNQGGIIAYPTEAVYGLGCDPFNENAVLRILALKNRPAAKGLILIAASWDQVSRLIKPLSAEVMERMLTTWPGPVTWVVPATHAIPDWICGEHDTIAIRLTAHPVAQAICQRYKGPIVSTSANLSNQLPAITAEEVAKTFPAGIDLILAGAVGTLLTLRDGASRASSGRTGPTEIRDAITGKILRS
jgi:L-threonylcarbamoyladenylate synthase